MTHVSGVTIPPAERYRLRTGAGDGHDLTLPWQPPIVVLGGPQHTTVRPLTE